MAMDPEMFRMLRSLPEELEAMGWIYVPQSLRPSRRASGKVYMVTYERPFEEGIDQHVPGLVHRGRFHITQRSKTSWADARALAIATMRERDAQRE